MKNRHLQEKLAATAGVTDAVIQGDGVRLVLAPQTTPAVEKLLPGVDGAELQAVVQKLTLVNPLRYFMVIVRGVFLEGTPFHLLIDQFWPLAVIGIVTLSYDVLALSPSHVLKNQRPPAELGAADFF